MTKARQLTDADGPVLVDFWAAWCGSCRAVGPTIEKLATEFDGVVKVGKLNIDENPAAPMEFGINSIPAVLLFTDGKVVETLVGVQPKQNYPRVPQQAAA